jgi:hypothetical protein
MKKKKPKKEPLNIIDARRPKENDYVIKRNGYLKILRVLFWGILIVFFLRGVVVSLQPTDEQQVKETIDNFKREFAAFKGENEEIMAFAQNFAREYLTYSANGGDEHKSRLQPYISNRINSLSDITDFSGSATANYVQAYRKELYAPDQYDVYVLADVSYMTTQTDGGITTTVTTVTPTYLKIPVYAGNGGYIVEDLPVFVADSLLMGNYSPRSVSLARASDAEVAAIKTALLNFLTAYYEADQSVIDYYLSPAADKSTFWGLNGRYRFDRLDALSCYALDSNEYLCLVGFFIKDGINDVGLYQEFNLLIRSEGTRYYIKDMDTKTINLIYQEEES